MKKIEKIEKVISGEIYRDEVLVCTEFFQAYEQSLGFDIMNVDSIFTHNVPAFVAECIADGISEITISDTSSGMITTLAAFNYFGCAFGGFTKVVAYRMERDAVKITMPTKEDFSLAMEKKLTEFEQILAVFATTHDLGDMTSWLLPYYAHPAEFDWDFDRMTEFVCNLLTHPKLPTDCLRYISSMLTDVAGEVDLIRNHPNCDRKTIEHLIHLALNNEDTQMAIELLPNASNSAIKSWVTHSNKEFADKAYAILLRDVNLLPMLADVRNRAYEYSQIICEVDSELSVCFTWICEDLDKIDFRKFSEADSIECAKVINRFIVNRKKLVDTIAEADTDAEFYGKRAKVISREEAMRKAGAADWEKTWQNY